MRELLMVIAMIVGVVGCAGNPFVNFYYSNELPSAYFIEDGSSPKIIRGTNYEEDVLYMKRKGYMELGNSSFNGRTVDHSLALAQAKRIGAPIVYVYSKYTNTESGMAPIIIPNNQTIVSGGGVATVYGSQTMYVPYSNSRHDVLATYWKKIRMPALGIRTRELSSKMKQRIGSNKGMFISAVIDGSPAYNADILEGDILVKINGISTYSDEQIGKAVNLYQGEEVIITLWRASKKIQIPVILGH